MSAKPSNKVCDFCPKVQEKLRKEKPHTDWYNQGDMMEAGGLSLRGRATLNSEIVGSAVNLLR